MGNDNKGQNAGLTTGGLLNTLECRVLCNTLGSVKINDTGGDSGEMFKLWKRVSSIAESEPAKAAKLLEDSAVGRKHTALKLRELADLLDSH